MKKNAKTLLLIQGAIGAFVVHTSVAAAQGDPADPAPAPPAGEPAPPDAPVEPAAPTTTTPAEGPAVAAGPVPAPAPAPGAIEPEAAPAAADPDEWKQAPVKVGIGLRANLRFQNANNPKKLNDQSFDELYAEPRFDGKVHKNIAWQANFAVSGRSTDRTDVSVLAGNPAGQNVFELRAMDLVAQFNFHDYFNVWAGRLLVAADRSNFSGPWFMSPWYYPGVYGPAFVGPKYKENGRDVGATVWGDFGKGMFKYFVGAYNMDDVASSPMFTGRLNLSLLDTEPGYYSSSTYYGAKKQIVAIGVFGEYQKDGTSIVSADPAVPSQVKDFTEVGADILAEFDLNGSGVLSAEGCYYHFEGVKGSGVTPVEDAYFVLGSYLFPEKLGWGKLQPVVRLQKTMKPDWTVIDADVAYVVADYNMKVMAGYQYTKLSDDIKGNNVHLGVQIQQ